MDGLGARLCPWWVQRAVEEPLWYCCQQHKAPDFLGKPNGWEAFCSTPPTGTAAITKATELPELREKPVMA